MSPITEGFIRSYYTRRRMRRAVKGDANLAASGEDEFEEFHRSGCVCLRPSGPARTHKEARLDVTLHEVPAQGGVKN